LSINIRSIQSKFAELLDLVAGLKENNCLPDVIALQEIWRFPEQCKFNIPGYQKFIYRQRVNSQGGGVGLFIRIGIQFVLDPILSVFHERVYETIVGEITFEKNKNKKFIVGSAYRPGTPHPNMAALEQNESFFDLLSNQIELLSTNKSPAAIFGDFNIDVLKYGRDSLSTNYTDLLFSSGFIETIIKPTRCSLDNATLIDHCITNYKCDTYTSRILTLNLTDHFPILSFFPICTKAIPPKKTPYRNYSNSNMEKFKANLNNVDWSLLSDFENVDEAYDFFLDNFTALHDIYFPLENLTANRNLSPKEPWFTRGLLVSRKEKRRLDTLAASNRTPENLNNFKKYRNLYNRLLRAAKKLHYERQLKKNQSNAKATWQIIKQAINMKDKKGRTELSALEIDGFNLTDPKLIAQALNEFFVSAPLKIVQNINRVDPFDDVDSDPNCNANILFDVHNKPVSHDEVFAALKNLEPKRTTDFNNMSMYLIKKCSYQIYVPLTHIFNLSFSTGTFPSQMKTAKVIPLLKSGDPACPDNYRPISLLSNFSKILEKIMAQRLVNFLDENHILSDSQFGFRKAHSTVHPMILVDNFIVEAFNRKQHAIAVFCDLRKAFDTVHHGKLLKKLQKIGVGGKALAWFKSYLSNRKQFVQVGDYSGPLLEILLGVPQGSVLGPILFLIYINDLPGSSSLKSFLFADDATLMAAHADPSELFRMVNYELKKVTDYFRKNLLSLNTKKTKYMLFTTNRNLETESLGIFVDNNNNGQNHNPDLRTELERISADSQENNIRFLGLYTDPSFTYKAHVQLIAKKISTSLFFIRAAKNFLTEKALKLLYFSLVHSHIIYAIQVWSTCPAGQIDQIYKLQKKAVRLISNSKYNAHTQPLFKKLQILPLPDLISFFRLQFMQKFQYGLLPPSFVEVWTTMAARQQQNLHNYPLRNSENLYIPPARLSTTEKHPYHLFPKLWSEFDEPAIKFIKNKDEFNRKLKKYFLDKIPSSYKCSRLFCPSCNLPDDSE